MKTKYIIYGSDAKPIVQLKLMECDDRPTLVAVDEKGNLLPRGKLCQLTQDGVLRVFSCVAPTLGFQLDDRGYLKTEKIP